MKKGIYVLSLFVIATFVFVFSVVNLVSAEIHFSKPEGIYNLGDVIENEISVVPPGKGFLHVDLVCDNGELNILNTIPNDNGKANVKLPLTNTYIGDLTGSCSFLGEYNGEVSESRSFEISRKLDVVLDIDSFSAKPGENITITGSVTRQNGAKVNGKVELTVPLLSLRGDEEIEEENQSEENTSEEEGNEVDEEKEESDEDAEEEIIEEGIDNGIFYGNIIEGRFSIIFDLMENTPAGTYLIKVFAYEEYSGERTSEGIGKSDLHVLQILSGVDVALNNQNLNPGEIFSFKPMALDQTGVSIESEISAIIIDENQNRVFEKIVRSGETIEYEIPTNLTSGYYEIEVSSEEESIIKKFYVNEMAIASFELQNSTLVVTNIGNIPYKKDIQVDLNGKPFVKKLNLNLGESTEFKLTGAEGEYDVKVSDGESEISRSGILLTGRAIGVQEIKEGANIALNRPVVWIFLIIILGGGAFFLVRSMRKKKSFAHSDIGKPSLKERIKNRLNRRKQEKILNLGKKQETEKKYGVKVSEDKEERKEPAMVKNDSVDLIVPNQAEPVLVLRGRKNFVAMIALKIKNKITKKGKSNLEKSIDHVYEKKAAVYDKGDYVFIIFSPIMTRSLKNEIIAVKTAEKIKLLLEHQNNRESDEHKIEFGIGIASGEVVNKVENKILKFTALGNLTTIAKKLATASNREILINKTAYERTQGVIRADKTSNNEIYVIKRILDRERNDKFLKGFLQRMKK